MSEETKKCTKCGELKVVTDFSKATKLAFSSVCKKCAAARMRSYYERNPGYAKAASAKRRKENPESVRKAREKHKKTEKYKQTKEKFLKRYKESGKASKNSVEWGKKHRDKRAEQQRKYNRALSNAYVAATLGISVCECPSGLIEAKREQLQIHRLSRELNKTVKECFK